MNRAYALVWNPCLARWDVAHEHARRRGKGAGAVIAAAALLLLPAMAFAADLPSGGQVVLGQGQIGVASSNQMVIDQAGNKLAINWQSFDIAAGNQVTFNQPGSDAIALNRVLGAEGSKIMGQLDANGRVFIVNPNGVLFGQNAQVNVGGLVASALDISDSDFAAGNYQFKGNGSNASVINNGQIIATDGGSVALLGGTVSNNGVIIANQGTVALAAGNAMTLDFAGDGLLNVQVDEAVVDALVENHQLIKADGGQVLLTANAGDALLRTVVNNTGVIEAQTFGEKDGKIVLLGSFDGGTVQVAGTLDASAPNGGDGGFIETSGAHVQIADSVTVTTKADSGQTGEWLIDPTDFTVSAGAAAQTDSGIGATTLSNNLNSTSVTLQTVATGSEAGDIHVNADVSWNAATTLTLSAHNAININASITAEHASGKVALQYGQATVIGSAGADYFINMSNGAAINLQSGANFSTLEGWYGDLITYTVLNDSAALQDMKLDPSGNYAVGSDIDLASISNWVPVGSYSSSFTGRFDGLGHTLSNLTINRPSESLVGFFGFADADSQIRNIGLVNGSVNGNFQVGGLVGVNRGTILNAYVNSSVVGGSSSVGGLVGNNSGTILNAYATGSVTGLDTVGGLGGNNYGTILNAYVNSSVTGANYSVGGLVGANSGIIRNSHVGGNVTGRTLVGGLVGRNSSTIQNSYATGLVTGDIGEARVGGLVGLMSGPSSNSSNSYWDTETSGQTVGVGEGDSSGVTGKTTAELQDQATYVGWDFGNTWRIGGIGASSEGYGLYGLPTLQGVTPKTAYQLFEGGFGNEANPWTLTSWQQLQNINTNTTTLGGHFQLTSNLDQNSSGYQNLASATANAGAGWLPIGNLSTRFTGNFDGLGHTLSNLTINRGSSDNVGLFGYIGSGSQIRNIGLVGGSVTGNYNVGGLVGYNASGTISNAYASGSVEGNGSVGGLVGYNFGSISNAYATGGVEGNSSVGGLVGHNYGSISNAYWDRETTGQFNSAGSDSSFGKTSVEMQQKATFVDWGISATGGVSTIWRIYEGDSTPLLRSFLTQVAVTADAGSITGKTYDGSVASGALGYTSSLSGALLDGALSYASNSQNAGTYSTEDSTLNITHGLFSDQQGYDISYADAPVSLTIDKAALSVTANNVSKTYDGLAFSGGNGVTYSGFVNGETASVLGGTLSYGGTAQGALNAGSYSLSVGGLTSGNYAFSYTNGSLTVDKAIISEVTGITAANRTYDGTTDAALNAAAAGFTGLIGSDDLSVATASGAFADKNAGTGKTVTISGITLGGTDAGNYSLVNTTATTLADIARATLIIAANDASKVAGQSILLSGYTTSGLLSDDSVASVSLSSAGEPTSAAAGSYAIIASDAVGTGLGNYAITYQDGNLQISAAPVEPVDPDEPSPVNTSQRYLGVLAFNGQSSQIQNLSPRNEEPANEPETANPGDERFNLQVINPGIRLPEGI